MKAYKCDRCGKYFESMDRDKNTKVFLSILVGVRWTTADLCMDCYHGIESWYMIHKLSKEEVDDNEMDTEAEQEVPSYGGLEETGEGEE